jgi:outer membrane protein OmpA-like peptidoglycan-associated protein
MNKSNRCLIAGLAGFAVLAAGCQTLDPYTGEQKTSHATKGALIGASAGAVAGLISGDDAVERRQHAMIGAGIGALAGGSVGYYMDKEEMKLRQELEGTGVSVTRDGDNNTEHAGQHHLRYQQQRPQRGLLRRPDIRQQGAERV